MCYAHLEQTQPARRADGREKGGEVVEEGEEKGEAVEQAAGERKVRETATPALANNNNNNNNGSPRCIRYYRCFSWCAPLNVLSCAFCIVRARL